ncbi:trypsin-like protease, partial [Metarhizium majus ARSEF 297]
MNPTVTSTLRTIPSIYSARAASGVDAKVASAKIHPDYTNVATKLTITLCAASVSAASSNKRIIGGEDAKDGEFPFIVSIISNRHHPFCGGSLLDSTTVLTAAHCTTGAYSVKAGTLGSRTVTRAEWMRHDIGVLKLSDPIEQSAITSYARLPVNGSDPAVNSTAIAAGWGTQTAPKYHLAGIGADRLSKVVIPIRACQDCSNLNPRAGVDTIVCAGGDGKNVCIGDSGGPLIDQETGQLIGVASFVIKDATEKHFYYYNLPPSVYTRVSRYITFIKENLGESGYTIPEPLRPESQRIAEAKKQVELHCTRAMNDVDACMAAASPSLAEAKLYATTDELLRCIDRMQACANKGEPGKLNQCIENAKACVGKEELAFGNIDALAQCAKKHLQGPYSVMATCAG